MANDLWETNAHGSQGGVAGVALAEGVGLQQLPHRGQEAASRPDTLCHVAQVNAQLLQAYVGAHPENLLGASTRNAFACSSDIAAAIPIDYRRE